MITSENIHSEELQQQESKYGKKVGDPPKPRYRFDAENHIHLLDGKPLMGTSTIVDVIGKPLAWYGAGCAVKEFGCPDPKLLTKLHNGKATKEEKDILINAAQEVIGRWNLEPITFSEILHLWNRAYRAHHDYKETRADVGTDMHRELEVYIKNCIACGGAPMAPSPDCSKEETFFAEWSLNNVNRFLWSEAHVFSERLRTGGITDAGCLVNNGSTCILDFKSAKEPYLSHFVQCGGYSIAVSENGLYDKDGNRIGPKYCAKSLVVLTFGLDTTPKIRVENVVSKWERRFESAVDLHKGREEFEG